MYKLLLCWRYLRTRYLALACIISVMLGVATLIVVNSVMGGFSSKLRNRLHGLLSDVVIESTSLNGFSDPNGKMEKILADPDLQGLIESMSPTMEVFAMMQYEMPFSGQMVTRPVRLIGVNAKSRAAIGGFREHLKRQNKKTVPSFELSKEARLRYEQNNWFAQPLPPFRTAPRETEKTPSLPNPPSAGTSKQQPNRIPGARLGLPQPIAPPEMNQAKSSPASGGNVQMDELPPPEAPPVVQKQPRGVILGHLIAHYRVPKKGSPDLDEKCLLNPGSEVILTTVSGGKLAPVYDSFVVVDYFKSEMSEYDNNFVFVPLDYLQQLRAMEDRVTSIQMKLKNYDRDREKVVKKLKALFPRVAGYHVDTWEGKQGPLLAAIQIEKGILNVLLFLIICVAGFGILAIFSMIVTEKTRDIGIMKALGASSYGVLAIFLSYGLLLGIVGAVLGSALGISLTVNINEVERLISVVTGQRVFRGEIYYFNEIPTEINFWAIAILNAGAIFIAVLFSILPALRAALLHPVRALRYE